MCEVQDFPDGWKSENSWNPSKSASKQFLSEALDFDKIVVCFSLFIISRFRTLWPITYYAYCLITPQLYPYHTKPYHGRSFRVTLLDIYGAQLSWAELSSSWDWARCRRRRMGRRTMAARRGVASTPLCSRLRSSSVVLPNFEDELTVRLSKFLTSDQEDVWEIFQHEDNYGSARI